MSEIDTPDEKLIERFKQFTAQHVGTYSLRSANVRIFGLEGSCLGSIEIDEAHVSEGSEGVLTTAYDLDDERNLFKTVEFITQEQRRSFDRIVRLEDMMLHFDMVLHGRSEDEARRELLLHKLQHTDPQILQRLADRLTGPLLDMEDTLSGAPASDVMQLLDQLEQDLRQSTQS